MKTWAAIGLAVFLIASASCIPAGETKLRILAEDYPPYNFVGPDKQVTGQSTEIVQEILKKLGKPAAKIEIKQLAEGLAIAEKGPAVAIFSINRTAQRENRFKWVGSIGGYEQAFYAKKGSGIRLVSIDDAKDINGLIGVYKGDAGNYFLQSQGFTNLDESQDDVEALKKLMDGKVAVWLGGREGLVITTTRAGVNMDDLEMLLPVIRSELYIAFSKDTPDSLIKAWQDTLDSLKTVKGPDGKTFFESVIEKYSDAYFLKQAVGK